MKIVRILCVITAIFILWSSCVYNDIRPDTSDLTVTVRWTRAYPAETKEEVMTGLAWSLSFLGASLPQGSLNRAVYWTADDRFILDIREAGFPEASWPAWAQLIEAFQQSEEYTARGAIDLGRLVTLTLNSTNHYYAITGVPKTLSDFRARYNFDPKKAAVLKSTIAFGHRMIEIANAGRFQEIAFIAREGDGLIEEHTFSEKEFEAMDLMPNGQLRFALYDINGNLKTSASPELTLAGKPAKCLWCHEIHLIAPFQDYPVADGYYNKDEFSALVASRVQLIDFKKTSDHTQAELLYISFMEPSAERLAAEWGLTVDEVRNKLKDAPTHKHNEFSFLGDALYSRKDVDHFTPYEVISAPDDARNFSANEPAIIQP
jgi:hypothetical protein